MLTIVQPNTDSSNSLGKWDVFHNAVLGCMLKKKSISLFVWSIIGTAVGRHESRSRWQIIDTV